MLRPAAKHQDAEGGSGDPEGAERPDAVHPQFPDAEASSVHPCPVSLRTFFHLKATDPGPCAATTSPNRVIRR